MKRVAIGAAAVVLALGAVLAWRARTPELAALGPGAYKLHYAFSMELARPGGGAEKVSATLDGALDLAQRGPSGSSGPSGPKGSDLAGRLRVSSLALDDGAKRLGFLGEGAERALATPFTLVREPNGRVAEVRTAPGLPLSVRAIVAAIANGTQYAHAARAEDETWRADERDVNGAYTAEYRYESRAQVQKTWRLGGADTLGSLRGEATARFSLSGALVRSAALDEKGDSLVGSAGGARSPFTLAISLERTGDADTSWTGALDAAKLEAFTTAASVSKNVRVAGPTPRPRDALLDAVAHVPPKQPLAEHDALRDELTEAVVRDPSVGAALATMLRAKDVTTPQARVAVEALLGARTPDADARAAEVIGDTRLAPLARTMLLGGATLLDHPGPRVVDAVSAAASGNGPGAPLSLGAAAMALGGVASNVQSTDPAKAAQLAAQLVALATRVLEPGPREPRVPIGIKIEFLRALGNLGTPECVPLVRVGLKDESELVRAAAAEAMRFQDPATVKLDLDKAMKDASINVRYSVLRAARTMGPAATEDLVKTALYFDTSEWVRLAAVYTYGTWSHAAPALLATLTAAAPREKSEKVRRAIRSVTMKNRVEPPFMMQHLSEDAK